MPGPEITRLPGNAALKGGAARRHPAQAIAECERIATRIESVDLAAGPGFRAVFAECVLFSEELAADGDPTATAAPPADRRTAHVAS